MLMLSRRPDETIVFPNLGLTIHVVRVAGNIVKLGVEAPPSIPFVPGAVPAPAVEDEDDDPLNGAILALHLSQTFREKGRHLQADEALQNALNMLLSVDPAGASVEPPPPVESEPKPMKALLVEDDPNQRELLAGLLRMLGCECDTAADGAEAKSYLSDQATPDLVLLDMWMPHLNGQELVKWIRAQDQFRNLKVFALSGTPPEAVGLPIGADGVNQWFPKPLNPDKLWAAIRQETP